MIVDSWAHANSTRRGPDAKGRRRRRTRSWRRTQPIAAMGARAPTQNVKSQVIKTWVQINARFIARNICFHYNRRFLPCRTPSAIARTFNEMEWKYTFNLRCTIAPLTRCTLNRHRWKPSPSCIDLSPIHSHEVTYTTHTRARAYTLSPGGNIQCYATVHTGAWSRVVPLDSSITTAASHCACTLRAMSYAVRRISILILCDVDDDDQYQ